MIKLKPLFGLDNNSHLLLVLEEGIPVDVLSLEVENSVMDGVYDMLPHIYNIQYCLTYYRRYRKWLD